MGVLLNSETVEIDPTGLSRWYLAYTKPKQESVALFNLEQQGFEAYLPLFKKGGFKDELQHGLTRRETPRGVS